MFGVDMLVGCVAPTSSFWDYARSIDQGWATVVAAFLGFLAIAYQTRTGFMHLRIAATDAADKDREARRDQYRIDRAAQIELMQDERRTLASALIAELMIIYSQLHRTVPFLDFQANFYVSLGNTKPPQDFDFSAILPKFEAGVFRANLAQIGILGPSTAHDVVSAYSLLQGNVSGKADALTAAAIGKLMEGYVQMYQTWLAVDQPHVLERLFAIYNPGNNKDPDETLAQRRAAYEEQSKRSQLEA